MSLNLKNIVVGLILAISMPVTAQAADFDRQMQSIVEQYLIIQEALAGDSLKGVQAASDKIHQAAAKLDPSGVQGRHAEHYKSLPQKIGSAAKALNGAKDIESAREAFKGLSKPVVMWTGMAKPEQLQAVYCSMAKGSWVQKKGDVANPYYGKSMLRCGDVI